MVYVVEIESREGERATKEYETRTVRELAKAIYRDLSRYPSFRMVGAWPKSQPNMQVFR